jgi:Uma2 family endonuclease
MATGVIARINDRSGPPSEAALQSVDSSGYLKRNERVKINPTIPDGNSRQTMNQPAQRFATYEDLFGLPEHVIGEIIHGQLITQPRPAPKHALASSGLGMKFGDPFQYGRGGPGGWWIIDEPELHLGPHILVPDLAGWRRERMPALPDEAYFSLAPDWICEVLSPGTARIDRAVKMPIYAAQQVNWLWLLDPDIRTLEVYSLSDGHWLLEGTWKDDDEVHAAPFAEVVLQLDDLWVPETKPPSEE